MYKRQGVTHLEVFATPDGMRVSEIACRPGGGGIPTAVALRHGVDALEVNVRTSLGLPPFPEDTPPPGAHDAPFLGHCGLPLRPGVITELTSEQELWRLPGAVRVDMLNRVGDEITGHIYSASAAGFVYVTADTEEEVRDRLTAVRARYTIRTRTAGERVTSG